MSLTLDQYRTTLINQILVAESQDEVKRYVDAAMKGLGEKKVNVYIIARFVDKMIGELDLFSPMNKEAQHWSNITMAKILFNRIKNQLKAPAN